MNFLKKLLHWHICYWGIPHRNREGKLVVSCYSCSKDRVVSWGEE